MNSNLPMPPGSRIWPRLGAIIVACVLLYYGFVALNTLGLSNQTGIATVLNKAYYAPGTSYQTMNIGGRVVMRPVGRQEAYVVSLQVDNVETAAIVERSTYETLTPNERVAMTYQRCRITGRLRAVQITAITEKGGR